MTWRYAPLRNIATWSVSIFYDYGVEGRSLPDNIDLPIIIGEFHFGALDRGMFHPGLKRAADQNDRADKYSEYVRGALRNPYIVGTHWFQYQDQPTTGRGDGENYQIGFVDIADTPYPEIIAASRDIGRTMYEYRLKQQIDPVMAAFSIHKS